MGERPECGRVGGKCFRLRAARVSILRVRCFVGVRASIPGALSACLVLGWAVAGQAQSLPESPGALLDGTAAMDRQMIESQSAATPASTNAQKTDKAKESDQTPAQSRQTEQEESDQRASARLPACPMAGLEGTILFLPGTSHDPCQEENQLQFIVETGHTKPLTASQKGMLAVRGVVDPFNLLSIGFFSSITIAENSHTAYGPGFRGAGRLTGYSLVGDVQGEFFGTFLIPAVTHEDPRYRRMPGAPFSRRIAHALVHTIVTQHDDGSLMPNYSALLGYPIGNELSNLYVPGLQTNGPATAKRILVGIATDPVGQIVAEFLPDVAKRIHIRVIFVQQILNQVALDPTVQ
jgi:hypothetical protein